MREPKGYRDKVDKPKMSTENENLEKVEGE